MVCEDCGLVHSEKHIDRGPEWRAFDADQKKKRTRTGAPMTYMIHDKGLSTMIDWKNRDIFGKEIPAKVADERQQAGTDEDKGQILNCFHILTSYISTLSRLGCPQGLSPACLAQCESYRRDPTDVSL